MQPSRLFTEIFLTYLKDGLRWCMTFASSMKAQKRWKNLSRRWNLVNSHLNRVTKQVSTCLQSKYYPMNK